MADMITQSPDCKSENANKPVAVSHTRNLREIIFSTKRSNFPCTYCIIIYLV